MFEITTTEAMLTALWIAGIMLAGFKFVRQRDSRSVAILVAAVLLPVIGSLLTIAVYSLGNARHGRTHP